MLGTRSISIRPAGTVSRHPDQSFTEFFSYNNVPQRRRNATARVSGGGRKPSFPSGRDDLMCICRTRVYNRVCIYRVIRRTALIPGSSLYNLYLWSFKINIWYALILYRDYICYTIICFNIREIFSTPRGQSVLQLWKMEIQTPVFNENNPPPPPTFPSFYSELLANNLSYVKMSIYSKSYSALEKLIKIFFKNLYIVFEQIMLVPYTLNGPPGIIYNIVCCCEFRVSTAEKSFKLCTYTYIYIKHTPTATTREGLF